MRALSDAARASEVPAPRPPPGADACIGTAFIEEGGLADALSDGSLAMAALDAALTRTLSVRFRLGMFDAPNRTVYTTYGPERINTPAAQACGSARGGGRVRKDCEWDALPLHRPCLPPQAAAVTAAAQGAVLLRNEGRVLPINATAPALGTVAVIGPHAVTQIDLL